MRHEDRDHSASNVAMKLAGAGLLAYAGLAIARRSRHVDLAGRVVLITGGSRGLGLCLARQLARLGAKVAICGRDVETLQRAHDELLTITSDAIAFVADVTQPYDIRTLVNGVVDQLGPIDVLINNVGFIQVGPAQAMTEEDYRVSMDEIFWSAYRMTEAVRPAMTKRGRGRVANITSIGGLVPAPHLAPYVAAKHAMVGWSRALHNELARDGIKVTTVVPGLMRTGSPRNAKFKGQAEAEYAWFKISDSLPFTSMSAERAAANIIDAIAYGDAEIQLTLSAKVAGRVQALFPNLSAIAGAMMNRSLPAEGGIGTSSAFGRSVENAATRSGATALTDAAARANNEVG